MARKCAGSTGRSSAFPVLLDMSISYFEVRKYSSDDHNVSTSLHNMTRMDNLNFDCLELIFNYLSGRDLVSISLVNRSCLLGVVPVLYRTLVYTQLHDRRHEKMMSCFATILTHPHLAVHVRHIDIRAYPLSKSFKLYEGTKAAIALCDNLTSFVCTRENFVEYLPELETKSELQYMRIRPVFGSFEASRLMTFNRLGNLCLDSATRNVIDILPMWTSSLKSTLRTLSLFDVKELKECTLEAVLQELPELTALHVVSCYKVTCPTTLKLTRYTPHLRSLAVTCLANSSINLFERYQPLSDLRHLALDIQGADPTFGCLIHGLFFTYTKLWGCALSTVTVKFSNGGSRMAMDDNILEPLSRNHGSTLTHLSFIHCSMSQKHFLWIAQGCKRLERLSVNVPRSDIRKFAASLSHCSSLRTLQDLSEKKCTLSKDQIWTILEATPNLKKIITSDRIWTNDGHLNSVDRHLNLIPEKRHNPRPNQWFVPPI